MSIFTGGVSYLDVLGGEYIGNEFVYTPEDRIRQDNYVNSLFQESSSPSMGCNGLLFSTGICVPLPDSVPDQPPTPTPDPSPPTNLDIEQFLFIGYEGSVYLASNPDLIHVYGYNPFDAVLHYAQQGADEGRTLESFSPWRYLASNEDLLNYFFPTDAESLLLLGNNFMSVNVDPLIGIPLFIGTLAAQHYIRSGIHEGRTQYQFDPYQYMASNPELIGPFRHELDFLSFHYVFEGWPQGLPKDNFDEAIYLASHGDLIRAFGYDLEKATLHYIDSGMGEGRATNLFDPVFYLNQYPDLQAVFGNDYAAATGHYICCGFYENRVGWPTYDVPEEPPPVGDPASLFDTSYYLSAYPDVAQAGVDPLAHFMNSGWIEQRNPSPMFNTSYYLSAYPDVAQAGVNPLVHFMNSGWSEGRIGKAEDIDIIQERIGVCLPFSLHGEISFQDNSDMFILTPYTNGQLEAKMVGLVDDLDMRLTNSLGETLGISNNGNNTSEEIVGQVLAGQDYFLEIYPYQGTISPYDLFVSII